MTVMINLADTEVARVINVHCNVKIGQYTDYTHITPNDQYLISTDQTHLS